MQNTTFLVTNKCNLFCYHCFSNSGQVIENELSFGDKLKAVDVLKQLGTKRLVFSGGEPLLYENIFSLISYAKSKELKVSLLTNATKLDYNKIIKLKGLGISSLAISIYSRDILRYDENNYLKYLVTVKSATRLLTDEKVKFKITIPVTSRNSEFVINIIKEFQTLNITPKKIRLFIVTPVGKCCENLELSPSHSIWLNTIAKVKSQCKETGYDIYYEENYTSNTDIYCGCQIKEYSYAHDNDFADPHVDANGDIYLCGLLLRNKKYLIGNINECNIMEIKKNIHYQAECVKRVESGKIDGDFCMALNREVPNKKYKTKLVCPIVYNSNSL